MTYVVDCSFIAKLILSDEATAATTAIAPIVFATRAAAPSLLRFEIANVLKSNIRKKRILPTDVDALYGLFEAMPIDVPDGEPHAVIRRTVDLAIKYDLTGYDAAYLELAQRLGATLVSLDFELVAAARALNVAVAL